MKTEESLFLFTIKEPAKSPKRFENATSVPKDQASINEIMVKIEMKKLNSIIANNDPLKNSLLLVDTQRVYPLCKQGPTKPTVKDTLWDKKIARLDQNPTE